MNSALFQPIAAVIGSVLALVSAVWVAKLTLRAAQQQSSPSPPPAAGHPSKTPALVVIIVVLLLFVTVLGVRAFRGFSKAADEPLVSSTQKFLNDYQAAMRNGGLAREGVTDAYFTDPFEWYGYRNGHGPTVVSRKDVASRAKFIKDQKDHGGRPDENGCDYRDPPKVGDVREVGNEVIVDALVPFVDIEGETQGTIAVTYTLARWPSGQPYRIRAVKRVSPDQPGC